MAGAVLPEAACGEPDDLGVYRDLGDGAAWVVVLAAVIAEHAGQGLIPGAGGELAQALPLARDPDAVAHGLVDGTGGSADLTGLMDQLDDLLPSGHGTPGQQPT